MKLDLKGIRFNTWLYFLGLSLSILVILGFLLVVVIKPYYRENRIETINTISDTIESTLLSGKTNSKDIDNAARLLVGNNVCAIIFNEDGKEVYYSDALGELCMLNQNITINEEDINISAQGKKIVDIIKSNGNLSFTIPSIITQTEMLLYGKQVKSNLSNYYLIINSPLEPVESYVNFILNQYIYVAIVVIIIALVLAYLLSRRISSPIIKMKNEALKLAEGNYDLDFESHSYSEINDLANTLDDATRKLSKVNDLRQDIVANVSHDIKTPLTMIKAYSEMIKDISGDDPLKREEHLNVIIKETEYLDKLVTDMTELSKLQSGNIELNKSNFDLQDVIEDVIALLKHYYDEKNIEVVSKLSSVVVYGDEIKLSQVVYNYLSNAIKYSPENTIIVIKMIDSEDKVRVEVIDQGDGISEEALPYIWDRYYKIDKRFNRDVNSTGLGLAIAKAILEAHNAKYGAISELGKGSTFYFELNKDYD